MRYNVLTPQQQLGIARDRLLNIEADHYLQDLEYRMAALLEMEDVKLASATRRDNFAMAISELETEIDRLTALIPDEPLP
jgi:hypothetical protein